jgi:hypothetical protein
MAEEFRPEKIGLLIRVAICNEFSYICKKLNS